MARSSTYRLLVVLEELQSSCSAMDVPIDMGDFCSVAQHRNCDKRYLHYHCTVSSHKPRFSRSLLQMMSLWTCLLLRHALYSFWDKDLPKGRVLHQQYFHATAPAVTFFPFTLLHSTNRLHRNAMQLVAIGRMNAEVTAVLYACKTPGSCADVVTSRT